MKGASMAIRSNNSKNTYTAGTVKKACDILKCFDSEQQMLRLDEITNRVGIPKPTAFRLIYTLVECGMLERHGKNLYTLCPTARRKKRYRFGYAGESEEFSFSRLVRESIQRCAYESGVELILLDNRYSATLAIRNAKKFVAEKVDLVIEFQAHHEAASEVASILANAGIPLIAIEIPHPGAHFYGANNYRAGWIGGHHLAQCCLNEWGGKCDELILMGLPIAGKIPQTRMAGTLVGIRELLPKLRDQQVISLNGNGRYEVSLEAVRKHLRRTQAKNVLIAGINDPSSLGALHAFQEAGKSQNCMVVGQNASIEARREMRSSGSRMVGSVAYFPERYGEAILSFAFDILTGKDVPPTLFVTHKLVTQSNVDVIYPNDAIIPMDGSDSLLFSSR
jgi:ribose transport system substrate-binding protein